MSEETETQKVCLPLLWLDKDLIALADFAGTAVCSNLHSTFHPVHTGCYTFCRLTGVLLWVWTSLDFAINTSKSSPCRFPADD